MLNNNGYASTLIATGGEAGYVAALEADPVGILGINQSPGSIYNLLDNATKVLDYFRLLQTFLGGADRVGLYVEETPYYSWGNQNTSDVGYVMEGNLKNNYDDILTDFQTSLDTIYNTQVGGFDNPDTAPMQAVNTFLSDTIQGVISGNALANMQQSDVPDTIVDAINSQFGTNLTIDQIPSTLIDTIQSNYINNITTSELQTANPAIAASLVIQYIEANPLLQASLTAILSDIAQDNEVQVGEVTGSMLNAWGASFGEGGQYNTVAEAAAGAGITTSQFRDIQQQLKLVNSEQITKIGVDVEGNNAIGLDDLLTFIQYYGASIDGSGLDPTSYQINISEQ